MKSVSDEVAVGLLALMAELRGLVSDPEVLAVLRARKEWLYMEPSVDVFRRDVAVVLGWFECLLEGGPECEADLEL